MIFNTRYELRSDSVSFDALLDQTCERLWGKKVQYALRRIQELEAALRSMEEELDTFLAKKFPIPSIPHKEKVTRGLKGF
ncbi:MAG: hypothetical protein LBD93_06200 [Treponema sp.]|nr:hypothetical protein [Treponema sp.]